MTAKPRVPVSAFLAVIGVILTLIWSGQGRGKDQTPNAPDSRPRITTRSEDAPTEYPDFNYGSRAARAALVLALPAGPVRSARLDEVLGDWFLNDPVSAGEWIAGHLHDPEEFDRAAALLATRIDSLQRPVSLALEWAEQLRDPALRLSALAHVVREWAAQDEAAALLYAEREAPLSAADRERLLLTLRPPVPET